MVTNELVKAWPLDENAINPLLSSCACISIPERLPTAANHAPVNSDDPSEIEAPKIEMRQPRHSKPSLLQQTGSVAMSGLAATAMRSTSQLLVFVTRLSGKNPLDQWLDPFGRGTGESN